MQQRSQFRTDSSLSSRRAGRQAIASSRHSPVTVYMTAPDEQLYDRPINLLCSEFYREPRCIQFARQIQIEVYAEIPDRPDYLKDIQAHPHRVVVIPVLPTSRCTQQNHRFRRVNLQPVRQRPRSDVRSSVNARRHATMQYRPDDRTSQKLQIWVSSA